MPLPPAHCPASARPAAQVAAAVARAAWEAGVSALDSEPPDWRDHIRQRMWWPEGRTTRASGMAGDD